MKWLGLYVHILAGMHAFAQPILLVFGWKLKDLSML